MKKADENAFPYRSTSYSETEANNYGLTKREYFAIQCAQGILAHPGGVSFAGDVREETAIAITAIVVADELLKQLESGSPS